MAPLAGGGGGGWGLFPFGAISGVSGTTSLVTDKEAILEGREEAALEPPCPQPVPRCSKEKLEMSQYVSTSQALRGHQQEQTRILPVLNVKCLPDRTAL